MMRKHILALIPINVFIYMSKILYASHWDNCEKSRVGASVGREISQSIQRLKQSIVIRYYSVLTIPRYT